MDVGALLDALTHPRNAWVFLQQGRCETVGTNQKNRASLDVYASRTPGWGLAEVLKDKFPESPAVKRDSLRRVLKGDFQLARLHPLKGGAACRPQNKTMQYVAFQTLEAQTPDS